MKATKWKYSLISVKKKGNKRKEIKENEIRM